MAARSSGTAAAGDLVPAPPGSPGWTVKEDLAALDDRALAGLVQSLPRASQRRAAAGELLVTRYQGLVRSCVRPYRRSPVPAQDLMQVGYVGLLKAIGNFDPAVGASLASYARPCISGELKRYFRDKRWPLRVMRPVQELVLLVRDATGPLAQQLGRTPADSDLARHLGVSEDELRQARQAQLAFEPSSLDAPLAGQPAMITLADTLGQEDPRLEHMLSMRAVAAHWGELPPREQQILIMDFGGGMTRRRSASGSTSPRCTSPGSAPTPSATSAPGSSAPNRTRPQGGRQLRDRPRPLRRPRDSLAGLPPTLVASISVHRRSEHVPE